MDQELFLRSSAYSRRMRISTMIRVRWLAIFCQTVCIGFVILYLGFLVPITPCLSLILISAWLNIYLTFHYPTNHRLSSIATMVILAFDILLLSTLLYFTGGLQNPFAILLIAASVLAATSLSIPHIVTLNILVICAASFLSIWSQPLPWYDGDFIALPRLFIDGIWLAIVSTLLFTTTYTYRVAEETRRLADALAATELVLQREKHLSALDGLAAAAAHELGTPLATIQLVVKEMQHGLSKHPDLLDDLDLLRSQTERCRNILKRLTSLSTQEEHMARLSLTSLVEEAVAPLRDFDIEISTKAGKTVGDEPILARNPGILYGLGNLLENAVDFARSRVMIEYQWTEKTIKIMIVDDGPGFNPSILDSLGEPYTTSRPRDTQGGGLGLGLFIAKTLLERSGGHIHFKNSIQKQLGAEIYIEWNRKNLI